MAGGGSNGVCVWGGGSAQTHLCLMEPVSSTLSFTEQVEVESPSVVRATAAEIVPVVLMHMFMLSTEQ